MNKKPWAKAIRDATGLSIADFCKNYLNCNMMAFRAREQKGLLYPNEALLICLISGRNPLDLFGVTAFEMFLLRGDEFVSNQVKEILLQRDAMEKLNLILGNPEGLRIPIALAPKKKKERDPLPKQIKPVEKKKEVVEVEDFIDPYK